MASSESLCRGRKDKQKVDKEKREPKDPVGESLHSETTVWPFSALSGRIMLRVLPCYSRKVFSSSFLATSSNSP